MAQPEYVPANPRDRLRVTERLPTPEGWHPDRPAEIVQLGGQPVGDRFGRPGPDQGYALKLVHRWDDRLVLVPGEHREDVVGGCVGVAMKRAGLFGRAPVTFDLELAFAVWGYLTNAGTDLVTFRRPLFEGCAHNYFAQRDIADRVPESTLRLSPADVQSAISGGSWRQLLKAD